MPVNKKRSSCHSNETSTENESSKPKRKLFCYSKESLDNALAAIRQGTPVATASRTYKVPRSTLRNKIDGSSPTTTGRVGRECVLGAKIEQSVVDWILEQSRRGFPLTKENIIHSISKIVEEAGISNPFDGKSPGRKWFENFMKRNPVLSQKKSEYLSRTRAFTTESGIRHWFAEVESFLSPDELTILTDINNSRRVFNMDETAMCLAPTGGYVIAEKGKPCYSVSTNSDKENITTLFAVNASGEFAPPLTLFKYQRLPENAVSHAPPGWGIGKTDSGWMTSKAFFEYFANVFNNYLTEQNIPKPVAVLFDGHGSHLSYELSEFCKKENIILICLPPNATHILQPLDVAVFAPMKKHWQKHVRNWRMEHNGLEIQKFDVPKVLHNIIIGQDFSNTIKNGFKACGLHPFDPNSVDYDKCVKQSAVSDINNACPQPNSDNLTFLEQFENILDSNILQKFKELKKNGLEWTGLVEYSALFDTWCKIHDKYTNNYSEVHENLNNDSVDLHSGDDFSHEDSNARDGFDESTTSTNADSSDNLHRNCLSSSNNNSYHCEDSGNAQDDFDLSIESNSVDQPINLSNDHSTDFSVASSSDMPINHSVMIINESDNSNCGKVLNDSMNIESAPIVLELIGVTLEECLLNGPILVSSEPIMNTDKNPTCSIDDSVMALDEHESSTPESIENNEKSLLMETGDSTTLDSGIEELSKDSVSSEEGENSTGIEFNNCTDSVLKSILIYPHVKEPKSKRKKKNLPSVLTSDKWLEIMKAQELEKQKCLEVKDANKKKREEARELKESMKKEKEEAKKIKLLEKKIKIEKMQEEKVKKAQKRKTPVTEKVDNITEPSKKKKKVAKSFKNKCTGQSAEE